MANLNKLLVHVPSNLCDGFKTKYVNGTDRSYDNKVVFLEKTQEIFTKGKLYGTNIGDFNDLKALVGKIPSGATSTNIVDYINEKINSADHVHSVSKKSDETLIEVTTSNKAVTIKSTDALSNAVSNANSAVQNVSVLGKTLNKNTNSLTVAEAQNALGLGSAAYENTSAFDAAGTAQGLINNLGGSATSKNGSYVNVKVDTSKGQASAVTVTETNALKTAVSNANSAVQTITGDSPYLSATKTGTAVALNLDETEVFNYVANNIWETYSA